MGSKGPSEQTVTQRTQIPDFLRPFVEQAAGTAGGALGGLEGQLGGAEAQELVAPFSQDQLSAFDFARNLATGQDSPLATATQQLQDTAAGEGFQSGQFEDAFNALVRRQQPGVISPFIAAGRGTGGLADVALGQAQSDAFASLFNQERGRQLQAAQGLPGIAMQPFGLLSDIGGMQQQQAQRQLSAPASAQQTLLSSALGGLPVSSFLGRETTQPVNSSPLAQGLGLGLTGLSLASGLGLGGGFNASNFLPGTVGLPSGGSFSLLG